MDDMYREYILDHYRHPHNFGTLEQPTFEAEGVNPLCGDELKVQALVGDQGTITEVRFSGNGCAISQASMSILSDELIGKTPEQVEALGREDILELLGIELTPVRLKCALLGLSVTKAGIGRWRGEDAGQQLGELDGSDEIVWSGT